MVWLTFRTALSHGNQESLGLCLSRHSRKPTAKVESQDISGGNEIGGGNKTLGEHFQWLRERERENVTMKTNIGKDFLMAFRKDIQRTDNRHTLKS